MCKNIERRGPPSCFEAISGPSCESGWGVCAECFTLAEKMVIGAADAFYDMAHSSDVPHEAWKAVTALLDKTVQTLRKARQQRDIE